VPEAYDGFAAHFDAWQQAFGGAYDDLVLSRLRAALARHQRTVRRVVDLGIGTGDLVVALARAGYTVVGVDRSQPMLDVARAKIAAAGLGTAVTLLHQDIRELRVDAPADAACCVYTVANQLTGDDDLARALAAVHDALVPGGLLLCEVNLPEAYARYWSGIETVALADAVVTREHVHLAGSAILEARVTIRRHDGTTLRDRIAQRPYADAELEAAFAGAGFGVTGVERFNPFDAGGPPVKALWSAQRLAEHA